MALIAAKLFINCIAIYKSNVPNKLLVCFFIKILRKKQTMCYNNIKLYKHTKLSTYLTKKKHTKHKHTRWKNKIWKKQNKIITIKISQSQQTNQIIKKAYNNWIWWLVFIFVSNGRIAISKYPSETIWKSHVRNVL